MHVVFMFYLLSLAFILYGSRVTARTTRRKFMNLINEFIPTVGSDLEYSHRVKSIIAYMLHNTQMKVNNAWLFREMVDVAVLLIAFACVLVYIGLQPCLNIGITSIMIENLTTFAIVCSIELLFFTFVVVRYTAMLPSTFVQLLNDKIQAALSARSE